MAYRSAQKSPKVRRRKNRRIVLFALITFVVAGSLVYFFFFFQDNPGLPEREPVYSPPEYPRRQPRNQESGSRAQLMISSQPLGAKIVIDERDTGRLTPDFLIVEGAKQHVLRLYLEGYEPGQTELLLEPGEVRAVNLKLTKLPIRE